MNSLPSRFSTIGMAVFFLAGLPSLSHSEILSIDAYLDQATANSEDIRAIDLDIKALHEEIAARDLELSPFLSLGFNRFWDDRPTNSNNPQVNAKTTNFNLTQPLPTGTAVNLFSELDVSEYKTSPVGELIQLDWEVGVTQSLWRNSFGRQTSLRRQRDRDELMSRYLTLVSDRQELLIEYESLYWDLAYAEQEVKIREENITLSSKILSYIQSRFRRSAAERTDLLQAQALVASRELQLQIALDNLQKIKARLKEKFFLPTEVAPEEDSIEQERALNAFVVDSSVGPKDPISIDALQSKFEADYLKSRAKLEKDKFNPALEVGYIYGQRGLDSDRATARREAFRSENDYHEVGVTLTTSLGFSRISKSRRAFDSQAEAQRYRSMRYQRQSDIQWADLDRDVRERKERIETARRLAKLQKDKTNEEQNRYQKGRSTAFQAITFEQESAESDLLVLQLLSDLRRTESLARAYIRSKDQPK